MPRVLVVDDEKNLVDSLRGYLQNEGFDVDTAGSLKAAREKIEARPELVILDWMLPDGQGIELLKQWRSEKRQIPIVLLTARNELIDKVLGLELGADDYLTKPFEPRELLARLRARLRSRSEDHPQPEEEALEVSGVRLCGRTRNVGFLGKPVELKKMEFELLKLFLEHPEEVFSREELLNRVWGYDSYPTTRTVDTHVLQLRQKLDAKLFETVRGIGYRFRREGEILRETANELATR